MVQHFEENLGENSETLDLHQEEKLPEKKTTSRKKGNWEAHCHSIVEGSRSRSRENAGNRGRDQSKGCKHTQKGSMRRALA